MSACAHCHIELPSTETGRPPKFCGEPCKRAAGYEITRVNRLLEKLEGQLSDERISRTHSVGELSDIYGRSPAQRIDALESEIKLQCGKMLELLDDE
jgi:hypothetical protein